MEFNEQQDQQDTDFGQSQQPGDQFAGDRQDDQSGDQQGDGYGDQQQDDRFRGDPQQDGGF